MPTTLAQVDIVNASLSRIGVKPITDILALDDIPAEQARVNWPLALAELGREAAWNCLLKVEELAQEAQTPLTPPGPVPASTPWAQSTAYVVGQYVSYGDPSYLYYCLIAYTSSLSFVNDVTQGYWGQANIFTGQGFTDDGSAYASGWAYKYALPVDLLLMVAINDRPYEEAVEDYEIIGAYLYTDEARCIVKYTWMNPDTTQYDSLFVECLVLKLAQMMATMLRQDDTGISLNMMKVYHVALTKARTKNAGERKRRRFDPVQNSRFIASRRNSTNG